MDMVLRIIILALDIYRWIILACILISFFPDLQKNEVAKILSRIADPFLAIFRKWIPPIGGIAFAPWVALMVLELAGFGLAGGTFGMWLSSRFWWLGF